jgi:hypothetical protein
MSLNIIKGSIRNVVDEVQFERLYKPHGWTIDDTAPVINEYAETVKALKTEKAILNYDKSLKKQPKYFNDKMYKSENNRSD